MKLLDLVRAATILPGRKPSGRWLALALAVGGAASGPAQVTGVLSRSDVVVQLQPSGAGDTGLFQFRGPQLQGSLGSSGFGSGGAFASTARVDPDGIDFQNGNASAGRYAFIASHTAIDITFTNDDATAVAPILRSSILPAGMGLFIDNPCLDNVADCAAGHITRLKSFQAFRPDALPGPSDQIAGASFSFDVKSEGTILYKLSGSIILAYDRASRENILITDFDAAQAALHGFRLTAPPGDPTQFGVAWDASDIDIGLTDGSLLQPGASMSFSYESTVQSFSRTPCFAMSGAACVVAYSSFGDPLGRGGGIIPAAALGALDRTSEASGSADGLTFATFEFRHPVYRDGVVSFGMSAPIVEPTTWAMLILGLGMVGLALRRRPAWVDHFA